MSFREPKIKSDSFGADLANVLLLRPVYRKPIPDPNFYGGTGTWHSTGHVDVQTDSNGVVVAVWFRCQQLPFRQSRVSVEYANGLRGSRDDLRQIDGIKFEEQTN